MRNVRVQRRIYCAEERELTKAEYLRLLEAARRDRRLYLLLETICGTGIRVSELAYFTVEAVAQGEIAVRCKNKTRSILIPAGYANRCWPMPGNPASRQAPCSAPGAEGRWTAAASGRR